MDNIKRKLYEKMLDPSLLLYQNISSFVDIEPLFIPANFFNIQEENISSIIDVYGGYAPRLIDYSLINSIKKLAEELGYEKFDGKRYSEEIPGNLKEGYNRLLNSDMPISVKRIMEDEYVFMATRRSALLSRLKKPLKIFEKANVIPIINLEKSVPEEWRETVRGIKKIVNWIAFFGSVAFPQIGIPAGLIHMIIIDP